MARPRSDIHGRIVQAARARFLVEGVDGASLRRIASDAGTNIGMVYYYFPIKDDLFLAVLEEPYERLLGDLSKALGPEAAPRERLRNLYRRLGRMSNDELAVVQLVVREVISSTERLTRVVERFKRGHLPLVAKALSDGAGDGSFQPDLPIGLLVIATLALGGAPQIMRRVLGGKAPFPGIPEGVQLADALAEILFSGIAAKR